MPGRDGFLLTLRITTRLGLMACSMAFYEISGVRLLDEDSTAEELVKWPGLVYAGRTGTYGLANPLEHTGQVYGFS